MPRIVRMFSNGTSEMPYTQHPNAWMKPGIEMPTVRRMKAKLVLLGEGGVGKTSLIRRFVLDEYQDTYLHTIGTKVSKIALTVPHGADVEVQMDMSIFDIMGQQGFRDLIRETYFHGAQGLLAVCDITRQDSLVALNEWIPSGLEIAGHVPVHILVNKKDLLDRRAFADEDIRKVAESLGATWTMTSARTGESVDDAFNALAIEIVDRAMRTERTRAVGRGLREKVLVLLTKRGAVGLKKAQFSEILRGVSFDELERELRALEADGFVALAWHGPGDFTATITKRGAEEGALASSPLEE